MLNNFLRKSWNPIVFRIISMIGFIFALMVLYFGSLNFIFDFNSNLVMFVLWVLWWPFLYVTLVFFGRSWCGFLCPIGLSNEIGNSVNTRFKKKNYFARYGFVAFILFFIIVLWEQVSGLFVSTSVTFIFLLGFLVSAFLIGIVMPRWGFCKYFCPIGTLLGVFSRLSFIGVRTKKDICERCETKECIRGGKVEACPMFNYVPDLSSNKDCLICTNCIKNCPHNSANLCFIKPGEELREKINFNLSESLFIVALLGLSVLLTSRGTKLFRVFDITGSFVRAIDFALGIGFFILIFFILNFVFHKSFREAKKNSFKDNLTIGGYVFLPLAFSLMFFLIVFGFITPLVNVPETGVIISKYMILLLGVSWSGSLVFSFFKTKSMKVAYLSLVLIIGLLWVLILIPGPLSLVSDDGTVYFAEHGEVVKMSAFSMGFDPDTIRIKAGGYFDLDISNLDIVHSFDIDELNSHVTLQSGENKVLRINVDEPGEYEYYCKIPGHREAGMKGMLTVTE